VSAPAISVVALVVALAALLSRFFAAVLLARRLRAFHPDLWVKLGKPIVPIEYKYQPDSPFISWCNQGGFEDLDDGAASLLGSARVICLYVGMLAIAVSLVCMNLK
jgi:hypothetical protein